MTTYDYASEHQIRKVRENTNEFIFNNDELEMTRVIIIQKNPPKVILKYIDDRTGDVIENIETDPFEVDIRHYSEDV